MRDEVIQKLLTLNREFYNGFADSFSQSRAQPQPGFFRLLEALPPSSETLLDIGCGDGRFGKFIFEHAKLNRYISYIGVDLSAELLQIARNNIAPLMPSSRFYERDMGRDGFLDDVEEVDIIACLAALQHLPGKENRTRFMREVGRHLKPNGRLLLSTWQFIDSPRQRRKIQPWERIGLSDGEVEPNDYLLTWKRDGLGYRYVCLIDKAETAVLAAAANLKIIAQFRSDGREGNLNLYTILTPA